MLKLAGYNESEVEQAESEEDRLAREDEMAKVADLNLDPVVAEEVKKKLGDEDDPDDGHLIEEIVKAQGQRTWAGVVDQIRVPGNREGSRRKRSVG